jgi:hypothetical protein
MASPLSVTRNDYRENKKNSTVFTPTGVAQFLFDLLNAKHGLCRHNFYTVFDPAIGNGRLTDPWCRAGRYVIGRDVVARGADTRRFSLGPFEKMPKPTWQPDIVLCNSPFNGAPGRRLYPEVFLEHIFELFGVNIPVVLFVPMGFLKNQRKKSKRWQ